jgi:hypothetical protein
MIEASKDRLKRGMPKGGISEIGEFREEIRKSKGCKA